MRYRLNFLDQFLATTSCSVLGFSIAIALLVPHMAFADILISEIMFDTVGSDSKAEWVELQNVGTSTVDISKWKINDGSNHVLNAPPKNGSTGYLSIEPGAFLILASDAATFISLYPNVHTSVIDTVLSLSNSGSSISISDALGEIEDKVKYTNAKGADGTGQSLQKIGSRFSAASPTPGAQNSAKKTVPVAAKVVVEKTVAAPKAKSATRAKTQAASAATVVEQVPEIPVTVSTGTLSTTAEKEKGNTNIFVSPWLFGALAIGVAGSAAALVAKKKKEGEWDIEEITEDA